MNRYYAEKLRRRFFWTTISFFILGLSIGFWVASEIFLHMQATHLQ